MAKPDDVVVDNNSQVAIPTDESSVEPSEEGLDAVCVKVAARKIATVTTSGNSAPVGLMGAASEEDGPMEEKVTDTMVRDVDLEKNRILIRLVKMLLHKKTTDTTTALDAGKETTTNTNVLDAPAAGAEGEWCESI